MDEQAVTLSEGASAQMQDHICTAVIEDMVVETSDDAWDEE